MTKKNYALMGAAGYVAPRHLRAIKETGGQLKTAFDPSDSVGIIDSYFPDARFFSEFERFDRHVDLLRRRGEQIDYVSICSPNYLHDAHVRYALRAHSDAICEKPLVLNPHNIDAIADLERDTGRRVYTILQLRLHPSIIALRQKNQEMPKSETYDVDLTYITSRGQWYYASWKGDESKSGGIATNIGIHFFDMLIFLFGEPKLNAVHHRAADCSGGYIEFERARVRWFLSINARDLPRHVQGKQTTYRSISLNGQEIEFSDGFTDLHIASYANVLSGRGFGLTEVRPSIVVAAGIRKQPIQPTVGLRHPALDDVQRDEGRYEDGWPV